MTDARRLVGATVVTQDRAATVFDDGEVAFDSAGMISYVGPSRGPAGAGDIDLTGHIVMPGLVNAHAHSAMTLLRGICDDAGLAPWLEVVQRIESHMTVEDIAAGLRLALIEMIRSGTTTFADMYYWDRDLLQIVVRSGMRVCAAPAIFGETAVGFPAASTLTGRQSIAHTEALASEFAGEARVRLRYGPHAPYTCSPELLAFVAERAGRTGLGVQIHLSESADEVRRTVATYGRTPILHADTTGLLAVPTLIAHAVHATADEIDLVARRGAAVAHNPVSNLKLGSGIAPLADFRDAGVTMALGTDSAASNNNLDLFEEIKTGIIVHRGVAQDPARIVSGDLLSMATSAGAAAVGYPDVGVLADGYRADVIAVRTDTAHATPLVTPAAFLAYAARGSDVRHVFIGGQWVLRDGVVTTMDEAAVRAAATSATTRLRAQAA